MIYKIEFRMSNNIHFLCQTTLNIFNNVLYKINKRKENS